MSDRSTNQILTVLGRIIQTHFDCPDVPITAATVADDVDGWDSLGYAALIARIERELDVDLGKRVLSLSNVGELATCIEIALSKDRRPDGASREEVYRSDTCSVMRTGGNGRTCVFFAGNAQRFAYIPLLEFERIIQESGLEGTSRYYVTDFAADFYQSCFPEVSGFLGEQVGGAMTLIGNSMGGYAALRFAERLSNVQRVLAIVPQMAVPKRLRGEVPGFPRFCDGIEYMVLHGEHDLARCITYFQTQVTNPELQRVLVVREAGHELVARLRDWGILGQILHAACGAGPWLDAVERIVGPRKAASASTTRRPPARDRVRKPASGGRLQSPAKRG